MENGVAEAGLCSRGAGSGQDSVAIPMAATECRNWEGESQVPAMLNSQGLLVFVTSTVDAQLKSKAGM
ncbi:hypothetical protein MLD38_022243 [Melastoma candidum]|uniref:Uncharacterized protein n=1 Tax=Melastoma candidum TaxID=119954 RepID=A0ACB9QII7_9MYRT|nr:hypothetical protein MLD38_022243 [Melastoma candidum]